MQVYQKWVCFPSENRFFGINCCLSNRFRCTNAVFFLCVCMCVCMEKYYRKQHYRRQGASLHRLRTRPANEYWTSLITLHWQTKTKCTWKQWKAQFTGPSFLFLNTNKCSMSYMFLLLYPIINTNVHNNLSVFYAFQSQRPNMSCFFYRH